MQLRTTPSHELTQRLLFFCHQQAYDLNLSFWEGLELKLCAILSQQKKSYVLY